MTVDLRNYNRTYLFYGLSIGIPWALWFLAGYLSYLPEQSPALVLFWSIIGLIGLFVPAITALFLMLRSPALRTDLRSAFSLKNLRLPFILCVLFVLPLSILAAQGISLLFGHSADQFMLRGGYSFTAGIYPAWFLLILAPFIEEIGWHTYGTNTLFQKTNLFAACLIFALFWGLWHLPLGLIKGYYQNVVAMEGLLYSANFIVSLIPFVIIMNWLYYRTNCNVIVATVFHIIAGFSNEVMNTHPDSKVIQTVLLLIVSLILVLREKELFFGKRKVGAP
jgi:membrane protease YdiL (CAAX protease family)